MAASDVVIVVIVVVIASSVDGFNRRRWQPTITTTLTSTPAPRDYRQV
jgi:hypothetical protein